MKAQNDNKVQRKKTVSTLYNGTFVVGAILVFGYIGIHLLPALYNEFLLSKCIRKGIISELTCNAEALNRRGTHIEWLKRLGFDPEGTRK
jgi:hypothetical protein